MKSKKLLFGSLLLASLFSCSENVGVETYFNISFYNYDGIELITTEKYLQNTEIIYNGETPTRPSSNGYNYFFSGWADEIGGEVKTHYADQNKFLYAVYNEVPTSTEIVTKPSKDLSTYAYTGDFITYNVAESDYYKVYGAIQTNAGDYVVTIRLKDKDNTCWDDGTTDDLEYSFVINKADNEWITTPSISNWDYGQDRPTPVGEAKHGEVKYSYSRDNNVFKNAFDYLKGTWYLKARVEESTNYNALESIISFYVDTNCWTIKFYDANGNLIEEKDFEKESNIEYSFDNPTKESTEQYEYTFIGWSEEENGEVVSSLTADKDKSYYPVFSQKVRKYNIRFVDASGELIKEESYEYGSNPTCEIISESNNISNKKFEYWTDGINQYESLPSVKGNQTYTAIFTNELRSDFGEESNPYIIESVNDLYSLNQLMNDGVDTSNKYFSLVNDLVLKEFNQIDNVNNSFRGIFNGNNHLIKYESVDNNNLGLFAINDGVIKNLSIDASISGGDVIGGLCATNNGEIINCDVKGTIEGNNSLGGLVGYNNGKISYCVSNVQFIGEEVKVNVADNSIGRYVGTIGNNHSIVYSDNVWNGEVATKFDSGSGTSNDPYIIATPSELAYLKDSLVDNNYYEGVYFKVENSLDLNNITWSGIGLGMSQNGFKGIFDGNNKRIYNVNISTTGERKGFFNSVSGDIKNVSLEGNIIVTGSNSKFVGLLTGICSGTIDNCVANGYVYSESSHAAGLVGWNGAKDITNSTFIGSVQAITVIGGIVGYNAKYNNVIGDITNCNNYSTIIGNAFALASESGAGGIVGVCGSNATISNCVNHGLISAENASGGVGGIIGQNYVTNIVNSDNYGKIIAFDKVGGIIGYSRNSTAVVTNCNNKEGALIQAKHSAGGISGYNYASIENCVNEGIIDCDDDKKYGYWVGGIVGMDGSPAPITNCINKGNVYGIGSSSGGVGGIAGSNYKSEIKLCENQGQITGLYRVGGIVGYAQSGDGKINECTNRGTIISLATSGPISLGGLVGFNTGYVVNCSNYGVYQLNGNVNMFSYLIGQDEAGETKVYDNINYVQEGD